MNDDVFYPVVAILLALLIVVFALRLERKIDNSNHREKYNLETYKDKSTGITMLIFTDQMGDVIYCEPLDVEIERR